MAADPTMPGAPAPPVARRRLARTIGSLTAVNALVAAFGLVTGPLQARGLGPVGRGEVAAIAAPLSLLVWLADLGLVTYAVREAARGRPLRVLVGTLGPALVAIGLVVGIAFLPLAAQLADGRVVVHRWLVVGALALPATLLVTLLVGLAQGVERWRLWTASRLVPALGVTLGLLVLFVAGRVTVTSVAVLLLVASLAAVVPLLPLLRGGGRPRWDVGLLREAFAFGSRAWVANFGTITNQRVDQLFLVVMVSSRELGFYVVALTLANATSVFSSSIGMSLLPRVAAGQEGIVARALRMSLLVIVVLSGLLAIAAWPLIVILMGRDFAPAVPMVLVLLLAGLPLAGTVVLGRAFVATGRPTRAAWAEAIGLLVTVPGLLLLLPRYGAMGAAWVSLAAYSASFGYLVAHARSTFRATPRAMLVPTWADLGWLVGQLRGAVTRLRPRRA